MKYPKMVYKKEKKAKVSLYDEVGYEWKVVKSQEEHEKLGSDWGDHPESKKSEEKLEKPLELKISKKSKSE